MAGAVGVGDWVQHIHPDTGPALHPCAYRYLEICCVDQVGEDEFGPWLNCAGKARPSDFGAIGQPGFDLAYFRLIFSPSETVTVERLMDIPAAPELERV